MMYAIDLMTASNDQIVLFCLFEKIRDQDLELEQTHAALDDVNEMLSSKEQYISVLKAQLAAAQKASKPKTVKKKVFKKIAKPVVEAPVVKRGRGRPRKVVA